MINVPVPNFNIPKLGTSLLLSYLQDVLVTVLVYKYCVRQPTKISLQWSPYLKI
jgi:hypothetical protein